MYLKKLKINVEIKPKVSRSKEIIKVRHTSNRENVQKFDIRKDNKICDPPSKTN